MVSQEEGVEGNRSISKAAVCAAVPSTQAGGSWERYAEQGSFEKGQGGAQPVTPVRAEPGLGRALHAPLILEGRKEGWAGGRQKEKRGPWSPLEKETWASRGFPRRPAPPRPRISSKEPRATFTLGPAGLCPAHAGTKPKAQMGAVSEITEANFPALLPGGPQKPREGGRDVTASQRRRKGGPERGWDLPRVT